MANNCITCFTNSCMINNAAAQRKVPGAHLQLHRAPKRSGLGGSGALPERAAPSSAYVCDPHHAVTTLPVVGSYLRTSTGTKYATSYRPLRRTGARRERPSSAVGPGLERRE